jgi:hypothetical protein
MRIRIFTAVVFLIGFGVFSNLQAASAPLQYSFSPVLEEEYLDKHEKLKERVELLEANGVLIKNTKAKRYEFFLNYPLREVQATVGSGFSSSITRADGEDFHKNGLVWPEEMLKRFFLEGFVSSILSTYEDSHEAVDLFPFFAKEVFKTEISRERIIVKNLKGRLAPYLSGEEWWKQFYLKNFHDQDSMGLLRAIHENSRELLNFGHVDEIKGRGRGDWRKLVSVDLKAHIEADSDFCRWGVAYLRGKLLEEKLHRTDDFSNLVLKKDFINKMTGVVNALTSCVNDFVRFAMYHRFLGLPIVGSTDDALKGKRESLEQQVRLLEQLFVTVRGELGLNP